MRTATRVTVRACGSVLLHVQHLSALEIEPRDPPWLPPGGLSVEPAPCGLLRLRSHVVHEVRVVVVKHWRG
jgi:hypothetical protein